MFSSGVWDTSIGVSTGDEDETDPGSVDSEARSVRDCASTLVVFMKFHLLDFISRDEGNAKANFLEQKDVLCGLTAEGYNT